MDSNTSAADRSRLRRLLNRMEIDRAVFYAVAGRAWQLLAGPVTIVMIAQFFTPEVQGFYYVFSSLLALQMFVELGFQYVIINAASHEWSHLRFDSSGLIVGDERARSRLTSLARGVVRWYAAAGVIFVIGAGAAGVVFLSQQQAAGVNWRMPWLVLVVLQGISFSLLGWIALLEGCRQVAAVNRFRLVQVMLGHLTVWSCMALGAELWTVVASAIVQLLMECCLIFVRYRHFVDALLSPAGTAVIDWRKEVWPLQWRLAVQGMAGYFAFYLFTPLVLHFRGAVIAGQMGMTWAVFTAIQSASLAWLRARRPLMGGLAAKCEFRELDRVFFRVTGISFTVLIAGCTAFCGGVMLLHSLKLPFAQNLAGRMLPPRATLLFAAAVVCNYLPQCQSMYIRVHRQDPLLPLNVSAHALTGIAVFVLCSRFGPDGAGAGCAAVAALFTLPLTTVVWQRFRARWHV